MSEPVRMVVYCDEKRNVTNVEAELTVFKNGDQEWIEVFFSSLLRTRQSSVSDAALVSLSVPQELTWGKMSISPAAGNGCKFLQSVGINDGDAPNCPKQQTNSVWLG